MGGVSGATGPQFRTAGGAPADTLGGDGDMYLDSVTGNIYGPKAAGAWGSPSTNIKGPVCGSPGQLLMNNGGICTGVTPTGSGAPALGVNPVLTSPVLSNPSISGGAVTETWTCGSAIGVANTLVKLDPRPGMIAPVGIGDTTAFGIATSTCATGGSLEVARLGRALCLADANGGAATTPGNAAVISTSHAGYCMDSGTDASHLSNSTRLIGTVQTAASSGSAMSVALVPSASGTAVAQSTLPAPYSGWTPYTLLSGNGPGQAPAVTGVTVDETNSISTPGSLNTGAGTGAAGSIVALRGTGMAKLGVQGATSGEWDIVPPANFTSWTFVPPAAPCGAHQWWTTDSGGNGRCTQPAAADLSDATNVDLLNSNQTVAGNKTFTGAVDASGSAHSLPARTGTAAARPAACTVGEMYFATDATPGQNWYYCTAANTWSAQAAGGAAPVTSVFTRTGAITAQSGDYSFNQIGGTLSGTQLPASAAQTNQSNTYSAGTQDFSAAAHTLPAKTGTTAARPATCTVGEMYFATDATPGQNWYYCTAANTWSAQVASGSAPVTTVFTRTGAITAQSGDYSFSQIGGTISGTQLPASAAQINQSNTYSAGTQDFSAAAHTLPAKTGTAAAKPATCAVGEMYFATDATAGQNWYYCTSANTWSAQVASGSAPVTTVFTRTGAITAQSGDYNFSQIGGTISGTQLPASAAQINQSNTYSAGTQDFSAAAHTLPAKTGTAAAKPASCAVGEMYFATDATAGQNWYFCTAINTWTQQLNSGSGGGSGTDWSDPSNLLIVDPFINSSNGTLLIGMLGWSLFGTGGSITGASGVAGHVGGYNLATGTTINNTAALDLSGANSGKPFPPLNAETNWTIYWKLTTPASLSETTILAGMEVTAGAQAYDTGGAWIRYSSADACTSSFLGTSGAPTTDSTWVAETRNSSTSTMAALGAISPSTGYWLRMRSTTAGTILFATKPDGGSWSSEVAISSTIPALAVVPFVKVTTCNGTSKVLTAREFRLVRTGLN